MGQNSSIFCCTTTNIQENNLNKETNRYMNLERMTSVSTLNINDDIVETHGSARVVNNLSNMSEVEKEVSEKLDDINYTSSGDISKEGKRNNFDSLENKKRNNASVLTHEHESSLNTDLSNKKNRYENISNSNSEDVHLDNRNNANNTSVILNENEDSDPDEYDDLSKEKNDSYTYESNVINNIEEDDRRLEMDGSSADTFVTTEDDHLDLTCNENDNLSDSHSQAVITTELPSSGVSSFSEISSIDSSKGKISEANANNIATQANQNDTENDSLNFHYTQDAENNKMLDGNFIDLSKLQANQACATGYDTLLAPKEMKKFGRKKCLILDLDETLVHSSFKYVDSADFVIPVTIDNQTHHVYVIKRPGVDEFLQRVSKLYEVVVFTASVSRYGDPLLNILDPTNTTIHHRLFRESCYIYEGNYVKNLSQIGRPLNEIIILDNSPASYIFHPQHAIPISSWFSDIHDNELLDILPLLHNLANPDVPDIGNILDVTI